MKKLALAYCVFFTVVTLVLDLIEGYRSYDADDSTPIRSSDEDRLVEELQRMYDA